MIDACRNCIGGEPDPNCAACKGSGMVGLRVGAPRPTLEGAPIVRRPSAPIVPKRMPGCCTECGAPVDHYGVCEPCGAKMREREHWQSMAPALDSIPEHYRWARWGSPLLSERVPDLDLLDVPPTALLGDRVVLLHGPTGAGKTSFACALGRLMVEQTRPDSDPRIIDRAQGFRFVDARDVPNPATEDAPAAMLVAKRASVLLLDDVGQEAGTGESFSGKERARMMGDLLSWLDKKNRQVIITTPSEKDGPLATAARWTSLYGGGVMRRFWEASDARVIELRRRA